MSDQRLYEGMFLFNPSAVQSSVTTAAETLRHLLDRADAQVEAMYKWDDRKLAYEIQGQKRALYMLVYFRASGKNLRQLERDTLLTSDQIMRHMVLRADHLGEAELETARQQQRETLDQAAVEQAGEEAPSEPTPSTEEQPAAAPEEAVEAETEQ